MSTSTASKTEITLKGSVEIVSDFFFTAINSILYQRGKFIHQPLYFKYCIACAGTVLSAKNSCLKNKVVGTNTLLILWFFYCQVFTCPRRSSENPNMASLF
jgi:mitotic spindle assembly checkpoint protein MAD2